MQQKTFSSGFFNVGRRSRKASAHVVVLWPTSLGMQTLKKAAMPSRRVAEAVVDGFIQDGQIIAFGHGSLAASLIEALASHRAQGRLKVGSSVEKQHSSDILVITCALMACDACAAHPVHTCD